jgi:hypothetical protein
MKIVLFCGGLGMRMRDGVTNAPKPMAMIGDRPLIWHVMRYYAHFGHRDFVLCLGYGASVVKDFFLSYDETRSNDFVLEGAGRPKLFNTTSPTGGSRSSTPDCTRRSASGCGGYAGSWRARRCSSPTTRTCSPTRRCRT